MQRYLITAAAMAGLLVASGATLADRDHRYWDGDRHGRSHHYNYVPRRSHRTHTGVYLDIGPLWWPYSYPRAYYPPYAPSTIVVNPAPTTYVQQPSEGTGYWYYCPSSQTYYPYVKSCPGGWMKVVPETPGN